MIATGEATPPTGDLLDVEPWRDPGDGPSLSEILQEMREDKI